MLPKYFWGRLNYYYSKNFIYLSAFMRLAEMIENASTIYFAKSYFAKYYINEI